MPTCRIIEATADRAGEIAALYVRTRRQGYAAFFPADVLAAMSVEAHAELWAQRLADARARCLLAIDPTGGIAGFTHISWHEEPGEVEFMYVATERQGQGVGRLLMAAAETRLRAEGCREAVLWVYEGNAAARRFYERCGWNPDGGKKASDSAPGLFLVRYRTALTTLD